MDAVVWVAVDPEEWDLLFSPAACRQLDRLADVRSLHEPTRVPDDIGDRAEILITSWSTRPFPTEALAGDRLRLAIHCGGSVRALFPPDALGRGVRLAQAGAAAMAPAVAEFALTLTLALLRNLHEHDRGMQSRLGWVAAGNGLLGQGLSAQQIGVAGLGRTGRQYLSMITALGAREPLVYDPFVDQAECERLGATLATLDHLLRRCDIVAVHLPSTPQTEGLIGRAELSAMRDGAILINTARAGVIDQAALLDELRSGRIRAGLDVFEPEPLAATSPLIGLPNVILTPHVAGGTSQARRDQGDAVVGEVERFVRGLPPTFEVTPQNYARLA